MADVLENFRKMYLKIYHLDHVKFLSDPGLARKACLRKTEIKLELLTDTGMLLMLEKGTRGGICHAIHQYAKAYNKYMTDYDKNKESLYIKYWNVNNLCGWAILQKLPVNKFEWVDDTSKFNEDFIKSYSEETDERYFLDVDFQYPQKLCEPPNDLPLSLERMKNENFERLVTNLHDKLNMLFR